LSLTSLEPDLGWLAFTRTQSGFIQSGITHPELSMKLKTMPTITSREIAKMISPFLITE
jgi:hypothetical protein